MMKIKRLFFPARCAACGKLIKVNETVCPGCADNLMKIEQPACRHCGMSPENCICDRQAFYFENFAASFLYEGAAMEMLRSMKFRGKREYALFFARHMAQTAARAFPDAEFDLVVGIPMTKEDVKSRGFNQSSTMAKHIAQFLHVPFSESALTKIKKTQKQHTLNFTQRKTNPAGAFAADKAVVQGKTVLLCDDIRTTGGTLYYAGEALISAGAQAVYYVTAALA